VILLIDVTVECDECGDETDFELSGLSEAELARMLAANGWEQRSLLAGPVMLCNVCVDVADNGQDDDEEDDFDDDE
jgi:hypothetical protein